MKNIWDHWVSMELPTTVNNERYQEAKRGSKRFCGQIVKNRRDALTARHADGMKGPHDLFFDSTSPISPSWHNS